MYLQFLQTDLQELMEDINLQTLRGMWFLHDAVPAHCAGVVRDYLNERSSQRWIGRMVSFAGHRIHQTEHHAIIFYGVT